MRIPLIPIIYSPRKIRRTSLRAQSERFIGDLTLTPARTPLTPLDLWQYLIWLAVSGPTLNINRGDLAFEAISSVLWAAISLINCVIGYFHPEAINMIQIWRYS